VDRIVVFMPIASTWTAGSASHLVRLGESGTSSLVGCPGTCRLHTVHREGGGPAVRANHLDQLAVGQVLDVVEHRAPGERIDLHGSRARCFRRTAPPGCSAAPGPGRRRQDCMSSRREWLRSYQLDRLRRPWWRGRAVLRPRARAGLPPGLPNLARSHGGTRFRSSWCAMTRSEDPLQAPFYV
jgi:hypothetical protein